jgi:hypothetical protein
MDWHPDRLDQLHHLVVEGPTSFTGDQRMGLFQDRLAHPHQCHPFLQTRQPDQTDEVLDPD